MRLLKAKSIITALTAALLLAVGTFTSTAALADHSSQRHGQQQRHFHNGYNHGGNRHRLRHNGNHGNRSRVHSRYRAHNGSRYSRHNNRYRHYNGQRGNRHNYGHGYARGHYNGNKLVGALVGGAIIYHIGRELSRY